MCSHISGTGELLRKKPNPTAPLRCTPCSWALDRAISISHHMDVKILIFPETKVAAIEHHGSPALEYNTAHKLIAWKIEHRLLDQSKHRSYGVHYTDPRTTPTTQHRVDFCLSIKDEVAPNSYGILTKVIPNLRCACARDIGFRSNNQAAIYLYETWLPQSGESPGDFPLFFHYINVGPNVREEEMITDVYLPLK